MKKSLKALFIIGAAVAAAGLTYVNRKKIKKAIDGLVKKGKIKAKEGEVLMKELYKTTKKKGKKIATKAKTKIKKLKKKIRK